MKKIKRKNIEQIYERQYPYLTINQIENEMSTFQVEIMIGGKIEEFSSNFHKYQRGWLARANYEAFTKVGKDE
jgi:hypothetical protein